MPSSNDKIISDMINTVNSLFKYDPFDESDDEENNNSIATRYYDICFANLRNINLEIINDAIIKKLNASVISKIDNVTLFEYSNHLICMEIKTSYANENDLFYKVMLLKQINSN